MGLTYIIVSCVFLGAQLSRQPQRLPQTKENKMSTEINEVSLAPDEKRVSQESEVSMHWGATAPKGGRAVLNRILKDGAKVPLFLGQTLVSSLRDLGYNSTTSALCEHVDNAIQWDATEIRVYFHQTGHRGD